MQTPTTPNIDPLEENGIVLKQRIEGKNLFHAPQPALLLEDDSTIIIPGSPTASATLTNMRTRINEIEAALIKLGLIRHI